MRFATAASFRTSLETRLLDRARREGKDVNRLRTQVAFERFLERVFRAQGDWVLKGGYALEVRLHDRARSTLDLNAGTVSSLLGALQVVVLATDSAGPTSWFVPRPPPDAHNLKPKSERTTFDGRI